MKGIFTKRIIAGILSISVLGTSLPSASYAGIIGTQTLIETGRTADPRAQVEGFIARDSVQAQLIELGVDPANVRERVATLTDEELRELNQNIDTLPAGGILEVIGIVFVILIILELTGAINIFNKV
jgi:hypothetical protein